MYFIQHCFICRTSDSTVRGGCWVSNPGLLLIFINNCTEERAGAGPERASGPDDKIPAEDRQRQGAGAHEDGQPGLRQAKGGHARPQPHPRPGEGDQGI
jgi:hypothetical protein